MKKKSMKNITKYLSDYKSLNFKIAKVNLKFDLAIEKTVVFCELHIKYNKQNKIFLNGTNLELLAISIDNIPLVLEKDYLLEDKGLTLLSPPKEFKLKTKVAIYPKDNKDLQGLYVSGDTLCSKCETEGFRRITFFPDRPDMLSRYTVTIEALEQDFPILLSNGNLKSTKKLSNGKHRVVWHDSFNKACYLFAIIGGKFETVKSEFKTALGKKVKLCIYTKMNKESATYAMSCLKRAMKWDEDYFGCYYDLKYMNIVAIPDFNSGACENKGLNIFNDKYVLVENKTATELDYKNVDLVIAHEYFHNWSGNKVTIENWFNLALKEGLTVYRTQKYAQTFYDQDGENIDEAMDIINQQFKYDASPLAHAIIPKQYSNVRSIYNSTTYEKAAIVFKMLEHLIGKDKFYKAIHNYFSKYINSARNYTDLLKEAQKFTKLDLEKFALWFDIVGNVEVKVGENYDNNSKTYRLSISHNKDRDLIFPLTISLLVQGKEKVFHLVIDNSYKTFTFSDIKSTPILLVNPDFTSPIKVTQHQSSEDLSNIIKYSSFSFACYISLRQYLLNSISQDNSKICDILRETLQRKDLSDPIKAKLLSPLSSTAIADSLDIHDFAKVFTIRETFIKKLSTELSSLFLDILSNSQNKELKNISLTYLSYQPEYKDLVLKSYYDNEDMTTRLTAFIIITARDWEERENIISDFYERYKDNHLVINKWLSAQALSPLSDTLEKVKALSTHASFSYSNPNKVYALLGSFARNGLHFHSSDGSGYDFFANSIAKVDKVNSQTANILLDFYTLSSTSEQQKSLMIKSLKKQSFSSSVQNKIDKIFL